MAFIDKFTSARSLIYDTYGKPSNSSGNAQIAVNRHNGIIDIPSSVPVNSYSNSGSNVVNSLVNSGSLVSSFIDKFNEAKQLATSVYGEPVTNFSSTNSGNNNIAQLDPAVGNGASFDNGVVSTPTTPSFGATAKPIIYSNWSPNAQYFGMDQQTAYAEHMANTAHQREVADLKAAGLNPVLGISGTGASTVSGSVPAVSSGKKVSDNGIVDVIGATAGLVGMLVSKNPSLGYMLKNVVTSLGKINK